MSDNDRFSASRTDMGRGLSTDLHTQTGETTGLENQARFSVFFDGNCPLCQREINWLRLRIDKRASTEGHSVSEIGFIDIAADDFADQQYGKSFAELMNQIHGQTSDGQWVVGVEVFRQLYQAAGFRKSVWASRLPLIRHVLSFGYRLFAKYRTRLTGRCNSGKCATHSSDANEEQLRRKMAG